MPKKRHIEPVIAAATTPVNEHPHDVEDAPTVFALTPAQIAVMKKLQFLTEYEVQHLVKASPDVVHAFDATALATIEAHPELGGAARAKEIRAAQAHYVEIADIAAVLAPMVRLAGQAALATGAKLALMAAEPLKVARSLKSSKPELSQGLASLDAWSHAHHAKAHSPHHSSAASGGAAAANPPKAPTA